MKKRKTFWKTKKAVAVLLSVLVLFGVLPVSSMASDRHIAKTLAERSSASLGATVDEAKTEETTEPNSITVNVSHGEDVNEYTKSENTVTWYSGDVDFSVDIENLTSKINEINDIKIFFDSYGKEEATNVTKSCKCHCGSDKKEHYLIKSCYQNILKGGNNLITFSSSEVKTDESGKKTDESGKFNKTGQWPFTITVKGENGNSIESTKTVGFDSTAPEITEIKYNGKEQQESATEITVAFKVTDSQSGVKEVKCELSTDAATEPATEPATESATEVATESTTESATEVVTESATEAATEAATVAEKDTNIVVKEVESSDDEWSFTATKNGTYIITATDNVGNTSTQEIKINKIDNTPPKVEISGYSIDGGKNYSTYENVFGKNSDQWTQNDVYVKFTVTDNDSGVGNITVSKQGDNSKMDFQQSDDKTYYTFKALKCGVYNITASDKAGCSCQVSTDELNIDKTAPTINSVTFKSAASPTDKLFTALTFGIYHNNSIKVVVNATDEQSKVESVELKNGDGSNQGKAIGDAGNYEFTLENSDKKYDLSVRAFDNANNDSGFKSIRDIEKAAEVKGENGQAETVQLGTTPSENFEVVFSKKPATVTITPTENGSNHYEKTVTDENGNEVTQDWYNGDVKFNVEVKDELSGINSITATFDGVKVDLDGLEDFTANKVTSNTVSYTTSNLTEGSHTLNVTVTNNSGNETIQPSTIYIDKTAPEIKSFHFESAATTGDKILTALTFGIYHNDKIKVIVNATDEQSGVNRITLKNVKGNEIIIKDGSDDAGNYKFTLKNSVTKYDLYVCAFDNANNDSGFKSIREIEKVTAVTANSTADEITDRSDNFEVVSTIRPATVTITPTENGSNHYEKTVTDENGNEVTQDWYNGDVRFNVEVKDELSGINSITATFDGVKVDLDGLENFTANKVTSNTVSYTTSNLTEGSHTLNVTVTNNSGNETTKESTIFIDRTAPEIKSFHFESAATTGDKILTALTFGIYHNDDIYVTVTAEDVKINEKCSGMENGDIKLFNEEVPIETVKKVEKISNNEIAKTFSLKCTTIEYVEKYKYILKACATDSTGNESKKTNVNNVKITANASQDEVNPGKNFEVVATRMKPQFTKFYVTRCENTSYFKKGTQDWYNGDVKFNVEVKDKLSGINSITATFDGVKVDLDGLEDFTANKVTSNTVSYTTSNLTEGSHTLNVTVTNNSGNETTKESTIYIDKTAPEIKSFHFESAATTGDKILTALTFGIYHNDDIYVTVKATDTGVGTAGEKSDISLFSTENQDKIKVVSDDEKPVRSNEEISKKFLLACSDDESVMGYKYKLSASATDSLGILSKRYSINDEIKVTANSTVDEITDRSDDFKVVSTIRPATVKIEQKTDGCYKKSVDGNIQNWYNGDVTFNVTVEDDLSGINNIVVTLGNKEDVDVIDVTENCYLVDKNGEYVNDENGKYISVTDFLDGKYDKEKVENLTFNYTTSDVDEGEHKLTVAVTNNSGNETKQCSKIFLDYSSPKVTSFHFESAESPADKLFTALTFGIYHNNDIYVTVTAEDVKDGNGDCVGTLDGDIDLYNGDVEEKNIISNGEFIEKSAEKISKRFTLGCSENKYTLSVVPYDSLGHGTVYSFDSGYFKAVNDVYADGVKLDVDNNFEVVATKTCPKIDSIKSEPKDSTVRKVVKDKNEWYNGDVTFSAEVSDVLSGIKNITVLFDGKEVTNSCVGLPKSYTDKKITQVKFSYSTENIKSKNTDGGKHTFEVIVTNNSGGKTDNKEKPYMIYVDYENPEVKNLKVTGTTDRSDSKKQKLFNSKVPVTVEVTDNIAINNVIINSNHPLDKSNAINATVTVDENGKIKTEGLLDFKINESEFEGKRCTKLVFTFDVGINSNDINITAEVNDWAKNADKKSIDKPFSIDTTKPQISVSYDNNTKNTSNGRDYFKADRTATITVTERNFNKDDCVITVRDLDNGSSVVSVPVSWDRTDNNGSTDETTHKATVHFTENRNYAFDVSFVDMAGNKANKIETQRFTIDKIKPEVSVSFDNNQSLNGNYFKAARTATVTVKEHNFNPNDVKYNFNVTAPDNHTQTSNPTVSSWSSNGDTHTQTISFPNDGKFSFTVDVTDYALNNAEQKKVDTFYIDKVLPKIIFGGVENNSANNSTVQPTIRFEDYNFTFSSVKIEINRVDVNAKIKDASKAFTYVVSNQSEFGQTLVYNDLPHLEENDGIYTFNVTAIDKAGNKFSATRTFSVNRFGSTYAYGDDPTSKLVETGYSNTEEDVVISEINVDNLSQKKITVSRSNSDSSILNEDKDYTVKESGSSEHWKKYDYIIKKANFEKEGNYVLTFDSVDLAKNKNKSNVGNNNHSIEVSFTIDKTAPTVSLSGIENDEPIPQQSKTVNIVVEDANLDKNSFEVLLDGKKLTPEINKEDSDASTIVAAVTVSADTKISKQNLTVKAKDLAQNSTEDGRSGFKLNAQWYDLLFANVPLMITLSCVLAAAVALVVFLIVKKKSKKDK